MNLVRSVPIGRGGSGDQLLLRPLELSDAADLAGAYLRNRGHLAPWEPTRDDGFFTEHGQEAVIRAKIDQDRTGGGAASAAVAAVVDMATQELDLHRIQAATLLHNAPSQAVLGRCGFDRIGVAPSYLQIAGEWQDHVLFQRILF
ncbi:GNAT family N-acetyltransferase [Paenarthrobacter histidinolovorans]|uniref:GNAT family N-acetyltransferase n=1 Tax=Paenarthrobacter histidinolovorans TaxID=43664 RepID=UPI00166A184A|nr:GNAT family N-acetyltransferase [Paenarthrobacter histidinolovorans]GGJ34223.1 hypothetical protein GCM10010052_34000 [Paenarthrobacter histidinolovorans]